MKYGAFKALDQVSFEAPKGQVLGLLGPNGAGKTTLMRLLTTYFYPYSGSAEICGFDIVKNPIEVRRRMGYLPETAPLYMDMQVDEYLAFVGRSRGLSGSGLKQRLIWAQGACNLQPVWKHTLSELSKGFKQRVGLAQALIHDPEVLILDEPTSGLDPLQIIDIRDLVRGLAREKTIIFSTHILQEVEALADRIVIINDGKIVANGTRAEITAGALSHQSIKVSLEADQLAAEKALRALDLVDELHYIGAPSNGAHSFVLKARMGKPLISAVDELVRKEGWPLRELVEESASLEEAFISLLQRTKEVSAT